METGHASDCATNNAPGLPIGPCDCGWSESEGAAGQTLSPVVEDIAEGEGLRHIALQYAAQYCPEDIPLDVTALIKDAKAIEAYLKNG